MMVNARDEGALERRKLKCPRCGRVSWVDRDAGGVGARCPSCGGVHLSANDVEQVICHELGLGIGELRAKASRDSDDDLGGCPSCKGDLSAVDVDDVKVELCLRCGAGWLDPGELERLTHGRHLERKPPDDVARKHLPKVVSRRVRRGKVSVPSHGLLHTLGAFTAIGGGFLGAIYLIGLPVMLGGVYLLLRRRVVVDFDAGTVQVKNVGGPFSGRPLQIEDVRAISVRPVGHLSNGRPVVRWTIVPLGEGIEEGMLLAYEDRKIAHRVAFKLSQLLEVPVEAPRSVDAA